jgi:hypothetical protein
MVRGLGMSRGGDARSDVQLLLTYVDWYAMSTYEGKQLVGSLLEAPKRIDMMETVTGIARYVEPILAPLLSFTHHDAARVSTACAWAMLASLGPDYVLFSATSNSLHNICRAALGIKLGQKMDERQVMRVEEFVHMFNNVTVPLLAVIHAVLLKYGKTERYKLIFRGLSFSDKASMDAHVVDIGLRHLFMRSPQSCTQDIRVALNFLTHTSKSVHTHKLRLLGYEQESDGTTSVGLVILLRNFLGADVSVWQPFNDKEQEVWIRSHASMCTGTETYSITDVADFGKLISCGVDRLILTEIQEASKMAGIAVYVCLLQPAESCGVVTLEPHDRVEHVVYQSVQNDTERPSCNEATTTQLGAHIVDDFCAADVMLAIAESEVVVKDSLIIEGDSEAESAASATAHELTSNKQEAASNSIDVVDVSTCDGLTGGLFSLSIEMDPYIHLHAYNHVEVCHDGHSFFRVLALFRDYRLRLLSRDSVSGVVHGVDLERVLASTVQQEVADYISEWRNIFEPFMVDTCFEKYVAHIRHPTWAKGGDTLARAVSMMYGAIVYVMESSPHGYGYVQQCCHPPPTPQCPYECVPRLVIQYSCEPDDTTGHYDFLMPPIELAPAPHVIIASLVAGSRCVSTVLTHVWQASGWFYGAHASGGDPSIFKQWFEASHLPDGTQGKRVLDAPISVHAAERLVQGAETVWSTYPDLDGHQCGTIVHYDISSGKFTATFVSRSICGIERWDTTFKIADVRAMIATRYMQHARPLAVKRQFASEVRGLKLRHDLMGNDVGNNRLLAPSGVVHPRDHTVECIMAGVREGQDLMGNDIDNNKLLAPSGIVHSRNHTIEYITTAVREYNTKCETTSDESATRNVVQTGVGEVIALIAAAPRDEGERIRRQLCAELRLSDTDGRFWKSVHNFADGQDVQSRLRDQLHAWWKRNTNFVATQTRIIQERVACMQEARDILCAALDVISSYKGWINMTLKHQLQSDVARTSQTAEHTPAEDSLNITMRSMTSFARHGSGDNIRVQYIVEWAQNNHDYAAELSTTGCTMQAEVAFAQDQLREILSVTGKCTRLVKSDAQDSLLASIALDSITTTEPLQKFVTSEAGSVELVQHLVRWARANQQFASSVVAMVAAATAKLDVAAKRARDAVGTMVRYFVATEEYDRQCKRRRVVGNTPLISKAKFLMEMEEASTSNLTRFRNGHACGDAMLQKCIAWVDANQEVIVRVDQDLRTRDNICQPTMTRGVYTDGTLHRAITLRLQSGLSLSQTAAVLADAAGVCIHGSHVPRTPGRQIIRVAEMALVPLLMAQQSKDFKLAVVTGVGADGGEATCISKRKPCIFRRGYCFTECTDIELEQCKENVAILLAKQIRSKAEQATLAWLELILLLGGRPTNYTCAAVVAEHGVADANAYKVAMLGIAGPTQLDFDVSTLVFALGDAASVITAGVEAAAKEIGHGIERANEVHHGWARMAKVAHRAMHSVDPNVESTAECYWRASIKVIRGNWVVFKEAYKHMWCAVQRVHALDIEEIERAVAVMANNELNMPTTFAKTRFLGFQKSVSVYFGTIERLQNFVATVRYLCTQDITNEGAWVAVLAGIVEKEVQMALILEAVIYVSVYKDPHLSALQYRGWVVPFLPRWLSVMKQKLENISSTVDDIATTIGLRRWVDQHAMSERLTEMCNAYGPRALAQLQRVFACYETGIVQFAGIGDFQHPAFGRAELQRLVELSDANPAHDQLGLFKNRDEVAQVLAGTKDGHGKEFTVYDTVYMKRIFVRYFWGAVRVTSQDIEGDVKELSTMGKGIRMSVEKKSQIVCLRRDAHADMLSRKLAVGQCEAGIAKAFAEARYNRRQNTTRRTGCYDNGGGVFQDIDDIFTRVNQYLEATMGENYLQLLSQAEINSGMYHVAHEAVVGPHDTAAIRAYMKGRSRPLSGTEIDALIAIGSSSEKVCIVRKFVNGARRSKAIPPRFIIFKFLAAELLTLHDPCLHAMQGGLWVNPRNVLMGATIENWVYDSRTGAVDAVAFLKVRTKPNSFQGASDRDIRSKGNEMMGHAGVQKCLVVEVFVRHDTERVLTDAYYTGAKIDLQPFLAQQAVQMQVSVLSFSEAMWKPVEVLVTTFIQEYLAPVLQAGIDRVVPMGVTIKKVLDSTRAPQELLCGHGGRDEATSASDAWAGGEGTHEAEHGGDADGSTRASDGGVSDGVGGDASGPSGRGAIGDGVGREDLARGEPAEGSGDDDERGSANELERGRLAGDDMRFYWAGTPDDTTKPPASIDMVQVAWEDGNEARFVSRCGIMVAVTVVRMLERDLPKGICVHGISGSAKSTMAIRVVKEIMLGSGYLPQRVAVVAPTNRAAYSAGNEYTIHKFFAIDLGEESADFYISRLLGREGHRSRAQYYRSARERMQDILLLIIDEISMVPESLLRLIDTILRAVRNCQEPMGGVTLMAIGDATQLGAVTNGEGGRAASNDDAWFFRVRFPGQRGGASMGIDSVLPNKVIGHEQYRVKCADLYECVRFIRWGGRGDWSRVAPLLKSRRQDAVGVQQNSDAFAALPTHTQVNSINDHRYELAKTAALEANADAREESYGVRAYVLQHTVGGDHVQSFEEMRTSSAKERLENSMQLHGEKQPHVIAGAKYMITKRTDVANRIEPYERFVVHNCDIVVAIGFVTDGSIDVPPHKDVNNQRSNVYPVMRDVHNREFVLTPKDTLVGEDDELGELHVVHLAIWYGYAGTVHVMQSTTVRWPHQLQVDLTNNFCSGQAYVAVGRPQWLTQLITNGLNASSIFLAASVCVADIFATIIYRV